MRETRDHVHNSAVIERSQARSQFNWYLGSPQDLHVQPQTVTPGMLMFVVPLASPFSNTKKHIENMISGWFVMTEIESDIFST